MPRGAHSGAAIVAARFIAAAVALSLSLATLVCASPSSREWADGPAVAAAEAAPFEASDASWEGGATLYEIAKGELGAARVIVVKTLDWSELRPSDGVLVLHPTQPLDPGPSDAFMKAGGRLAILDDFGEGDRTLRRFKIERTRAPAKPIASLRNNPDLPIAEPAFDPNRGAGPHPVVANVQRMVLNHPTALIHPNLSPVLRIRAVGEPDAIVAVAGQVGEGRLFAMSDPSAVIDAMLRYPGNRAFAAGLARYLVEPANRTGGPGRLFIVANDFKQEGGFGGDQSLGDALESQLEGLMAALADARKDGLPPWSLAVVAAALALATALWVWRTSARPYASPLPRYARAVPLIARGGVAGRFAMLAARTSPRSLALLELKSAIYETVSVRVPPHEAPNAERVLAAVRERGGGPLALALRDELATMNRVEAAVVAGRKPRVRAADLDRAARIVGRALAALGAPGAGLHHPDTDSEAPRTRGAPIASRPADSGSDNQDSRSLT